MMKRFFCFSLILLAAALAQAKSRISVTIYERGQERWFAPSRPAIHQQDSVDLRNVTSGAIELQYRRSKDLNAPYSPQDWQSIGIIKSFKIDGWENAKLKLIFGHDQPNPSKYPDCQVRPEICVWIPAAVGDFFEFRDPHFNTPIPIPPVLNFYIFGPGGGDEGDFTLPSRSETSPAL